MAVKGGLEFMRSNVPKLDGVVGTTGGKGFAIRTEGDGPDRGAMAVEGGQEFMRGDVPELDGFVGTTGGEDVRIGTPSDG